MSRPPEREKTKKKTGKDTETGKIGDHRSRPGPIRITGVKEKAVERLKKEKGGLRHKEGKKELILP